MSRVPKTLMPERRGGGDMEGGHREVKRVERPRAITSDDLSPRLKILHRAAKGVKFHRNIVVGSKLAYGNQVLNKVRGH